MPHLLRLLLEERAGLHSQPAGDLQILQVFQPALRGALRRAAGA